MKMLGGRKDFQEEETSDMKISFIRRILIPLCVRGSISMIKTQKGMVEDRTTKGLYLEPLMHSWSHEEIFQPPKIQKFKKWCLAYVGPSAEVSPSSSLPLLHQRSNYFQYNHCGWIEYQTGVTGKCKRDVVGNIKDF